LGCVFSSHSMCFLSAMFGVLVESKGFECCATIYRRAR
jgi:hypothetical protein